MYQIRYRSGLRSVSRLGNSRRSPLRRPAPLPAPSLLDAYGASLSAPSASGSSAPENLTRPLNTSWRFLPAQIVVVSRFILLFIISLFRLSILVAGAPAVMAARRGYYRRPSVTPPRRHRNRSSCRLTRRTLSTIHALRSPPNLAVATRDADIYPLNIFPRSYSLFLHGVRHSPFHRHHPPIYSV